MKRSLISLLLIILLLDSCNNKVQTLLDGIWCIEEIQYNNDNIRGLFLSNIMCFDRNGTCTLPAPFENRFLEKGLWEITNLDNHPYKMIIDAEYDLFSEEYDLTFEKDNERKVLILILISKNGLYIKASKMMYNIDSDPKLIDDIIKNKS